MQLIARNYALLLLLFVVVVVVCFLVFIVVVVVSLKYVYAPCYKERVCYKIVLSYYKAGGSNFMRTHEGTFSFLPTDVEQQRHTSMAGATTMLLSK